jgi:hypothetical protein
MTRVPLAPSGTSVNFVMHAWQSQKNSIFLGGFDEPIALGPFGVSKRKSFPV